MRLAQRSLTRLGNSVARRRGDQRLQEESEEHFALQTEENARAGTPLAEARRQAALKLSGAGEIRDNYHDEGGLPL